jgi:hypothetical protein
MDLLLRAIFFCFLDIVQVLVDCVLMMYPLMAFSSGMSPLLGVLGTGLLTTSYQGLFDLGAFRDSGFLARMRSDDGICRLTISATLDCSSSKTVS